MHNDFVFGPWSKTFPASRTNILLILLQRLYFNKELNAELVAMLEMQGLLDRDRLAHGILESKPCLQGIDLVMPMGHCLCRRHLWRHIGRCHGLGENPTYNHAHIEEPGASRLGCKGL